MFAISTKNYDANSSDSQNKKTLQSDFPHSHTLPDQKREMQPIKSI